MDDWLFIAIPLVSFLCNVFLLLALLSARKSRQIGAFITLMIGFVLWTAGSLLMRLDIFPGVVFWFQVSAFGIFMTPFGIYFFLFHYTKRKSYFSLHLWMFAWLIVISMNISGLFMVNPQVTTVNGIREFSYSITYLAFIPAVLAGLTLVAALRLIVVSIKKDGVSPSVYTPLMVGVVIMFLGILIQNFFGILGASSDTIFCLVNAICLYYALYRKRLITLTAIASNLPIYFMAIAFATLIGTIAYPVADAFFSRLFRIGNSEKVLYIALAFSLLTILSYCVVHWLMSKLFVKGQEAREKELAKLSHEISQFLEISDTVGVFREFLVSNIDCDVAYICLLDETGEKYATVACTQNIRSHDFSIMKSNPLVNWLRENNESITYHDFCKTKYYKSMWVSEKKALADIGLTLVLPINCDGELTGITFFTAKNKNKPFTSSEISFLESAAGIVAISFKNASLYMKIQNEARRDAITGLYNRNHFLRHVTEDFARSKHDKFTIAIISLDDFRLFNELYGSPEGDKALKKIAEVITAVVNGRGMIARYSGKEFIISLPFCSIDTAKDIVEQCRELFNQTLNPEKGVYRKFLTFSAGISGYPASATNVDETINYANLAVYSAKKNGKNRTFIYSYNHADEADSSKREAQSKQQIAENAISTILALTAAIDAKDHYTFNHSNNVSLYASILAENIGLDSEHVEIIRQAGVLHDIGKIGIPEAILAKKGPLTAEEYEIMKQHVEGSISMIRHLPSLDYVIPVAIGHHERWDGRGYPRGIKGEDIPIGARCLCLADSMDAMTTKRSYRNAMSVESALLEIERNLGTQFDPVLGRKFMDLVKSGVIAIEPSE